MCVLLKKVNHRKLYSCYNNVMILNVYDVRYGSSQGNFFMEIVLMRKSLY